MQIRDVHPVAMESEGRATGAGATDVGGSVLVIEEMARASGICGRELM
jgi:hypothetical protein